MNAATVPQRIRALYGAPALGLAAIQLLLNAFVQKHYTDVVGLGVGFVATVIVGVRLFDAVTDPLIGYLSDHTHSRWGRRPPWILGAAAPLAVTFLALMSPQWRGDIDASTWFVLGIFLVYLFWTAVSVPYEALGAVLSPDYDERTSLLGLREMFVIGGTLLAAASPTFVHALLGLDHSPETAPSAFVAMGWTWSALTLVLCAWCAFGVPEPHHEHPITGIDIRTTLHQVWSNRSFRILLAAYTVAAFGSHLPATMLLYYTQYVLGYGRGDLILLLYMTMAAVALPVWIRLAHRYGKKETWLASMGVIAGAFVWTIFLHEGQVVLFVVIVAVTGTAGGAVLALPYAMQADVIDEDELASGERREGQYLGLWSLSKKIAAAAGIGLGLALMNAAGYRPNQIQTDRVKLALRVAYIVIPCICFGLAILIGRRYPLDRGRHEEIRRQLAGRASEETSY